MKTYKINNSLISYKIANKKYIYVDELYVDESERRQGIGSNLLSYVKLYAIRQKMPIKLVATPQTKAITKLELISFYKKNGFVSSENQINFMIWECK